LAIPKLLTEMKSIGFTSKIDFDQLMKDFDEMKQNYPFLQKQV
jgi:hypothetical protein